MEMAQRCNSRWAIFFIILIHLFLIMNILGVNISHHASIAMYSNGKITQYYEEDRFNHIKYWSPLRKDSVVNFLSLDKITDQIDAVSYASFFSGDRDFEVVSTLQESLGSPEYYFNTDNHHLYHAVCGFYFSKFEESIVIVMDGGGSSRDNYEEQESIFQITKNTITKRYSHLSNWRSNKTKVINDTTTYTDNGTEYVLSSTGGMGVLFNKISQEVGFSGGFDAGKLMGLSCYDENDNRFNKLSIQFANFAQDRLYETVCMLVKKSIAEYSAKNIILSGGCALNCVNNYKIAQTFKDINFFIDPVPHDGGTSIGAAIYYADYK